MVLVTTTLQARCLSVVMVAIIGEMTMEAGTSAFAMVAYSNHDARNPSIGIITSTVPGYSKFQQPYWSVRAAS